MRLQRRSSKAQSRTREPKQHESESTGAHLQLLIPKVLQSEARPPRGRGGAEVQRAVHAVVLAVARARRARAAALPAARAVACPGQGHVEEATQLVAVAVSRASQ